MYNVKSINSVLVDDIASLSPAGLQKMLNVAYTYSCLRHLFYLHKDLALLGLVSEAPNNWVTGEKDISINDSYKH